MKVTGVSPFVVTNTNDFNFGSLRYAMAIADDSAGADTITFASTLAGQTITLNSSEGGGSARA